MEMLSSKQKKIIIIAGVVVVFVFMYYMSTINRGYESIDNSEIIESTEEDMTEEKQEEKSEIIIHITGAVQSEGIVKIKQGDRIRDAIEAAGGLTIDANLNEVNLAYKLSDGQKVYIPKTTDTDEEIIIDNGSGEKVIVDTAKEITNNIKVNINNATEEQLKTLPGIGEETARKIIEHRQLNGRFALIEDIKNVSGIGEAKFENIKEYICVD